MMSGTTWIELFALFDTSGARSNERDHIREPEANKSAGKGWKKPRNTKAKKKVKGSI